MEARRVELRISWRKLAQLAEMSQEGLRQIRRGERNPGSVTKAKLEDTLRWAHGSIDSVLDGGDPWSVDSRPHSEPATGADLPSGIRDDDEAAIWRVGIQRGWPEDRRWHLIFRLRDDKAAS